MNSRAIIVLGMHRSGTSALAGVLSMLGAEPGSSLMPADRAINPKGFWEHEDIVAIHDQMLEALGSFWHDERELPGNWWLQPVVIPFRQKLIDVVRRDFVHISLWMLKDPRLCRLLPLWREIFLELGCAPHYVLCMRNPFEVARSLERRDGFFEAKSCLLWLVHLLEAEQWTRGYPRVMVTYEQLLTDWKATSHVIGEELSLPFQTDIPAVAARIDDFLEASLRHHHAPKSGLSASRLPQLAAEAYKISQSVPVLQSVDALAPFAKEVGEIIQTLAPWASEIHILGKTAQTLTRQNISLEEEIGRVKSTISWRVTKPLRLLAFLKRRSFELLRDGFNGKGLTLQKHAETGLKE